MKLKKHTHTCGELSLTDVGKAVTLNGWVDEIRDLGGVVFINLRDRYGVTQLTFNPDNKESYELSSKLGLEYVISAFGKIQKRSSSNPKMKTGEIEVLVSETSILNTSEVPPFVVEEEVKASEELRFRYRYLDMRRKKITDNLILRSNVYQIVHKYFEKLDFIEVETPILMKSTPEGARDYLVPSRIHKGKFFALPQSPQTYKQILMVGGLDRYVQICKCFRDEDLRADRQPEFTQIDLEMSFVEQEDVFDVCEGMICEIWKQTIGVELPRPFVRFTYDEAMTTYGTDKPDLRYKMEIKHKWSSFKKDEFRTILDSFPDGELAGIKLEGKEVSRKVFDELNNFIKSIYNARLNYIKIQDNEIVSTLKKFLTDDELQKTIQTFQAKSGDTIFLLIGEPKKIREVLGQLRIKLAEIFNLIDNNAWSFVWVNDFPLFRFNEDENRFEGEHHVFTMPKDEYLKFLDSKDRKEIESIRANCYDLVCNGNEFGSGSIRIHKSEIQKKVFNIIGLSDEEAKQKFGFVLEAFTYGAPPHGGFAFGFDRIVAILCGTRDIREAIAFPKTLKALSLMDECPSVVDKKQLDELGIELKSNDK